MAHTRNSRRRLAEFPSEIIENILFFLPAATIQESLLKVDDLRQFIIDKYFIQEIQLHLEPENGARCFGAETISDTLDVNQISGIDKIEEFLSSNSSVIPHKYVVISDKANRLVLGLLQSFRDTLSRASQLEIRFPSPNPGMNEVFLLSDMFSSPSETDKQSCISAELMDLIYSFPNIYSLEVWSKHQLSSSVLPPRSVKRFKLEVLGFLDWSCVSVPRNLTHLNICSTLSSDGFSSGGNVTKDVLSQILGTKILAKSSRHLESLVSLCISNCSLHSLDFSFFPPTLEYLEYSGNGSLTIDEDPKKSSWPKGLKFLALAHNNINDATLKKLDNLGWPRHLEELDLTGNSFERLDYITRLPQTLKILKLGANRFTTLDGLDCLPSSLEVLDLMYSHCLKTLKVTHGSEKYSYFEFPKSLRTLSMGHCDGISWELDEDGTASLRRIRFPDSLENLGLQATRLTTLAYFVFPKSLKSLLLYFNNIQDLRSYNSSAGSEELVSWNHLTSLRMLDLAHTELNTLEGWVPPRSLCQLNLAGNEYCCSDTRVIPLFSRRFQSYTDNLRGLYLGNVNVDAADPDFYLPQNLTVLDLSANKNFDFESFSSLSRHENLVELNLAKNGIDEVDPSWQLPPNIRNVVLSYIQMSFPQPTHSLASYEHL